MFPLHPLPIDKAIHSARERARIVRRQTDLIQQALMSYSRQRFPADLVFELQALEEESSQLTHLFQTLEIQHA